MEFPIKQRAASACPVVAARAAAGIFAVLLLCGGNALAQSAPKWGPSIDFEAKPGTKRSLGEADLFVPFAQTDTTLLFANARARFDDDSNREGNFGLGLRHMLAGWNFGVYGYYDRKRTEFDNYFNQATFGLEALGRDFDFRANLYLPFGERVKDLGSTEGGASIASLIGTTIQVTTPGGVTREERALRGFDVEIGWRVPFWAESDSKALRLYAGMFRFDDSVVEPVIGPRLRAEFTMYEIPGLWEGTRLTLGAEYQHDDVRGDQGFGLVRLSVPLQPPSKTYKLTPQERRMTERVVRDVDVVTQSYTAQAAPIVETATQTAGGSAVTVVDSGTTTGAALPGAVAAAGANATVILSGSFNTTTSTFLQAGQTLMGAGTLVVQTPSGRTASLTTPGAAISNTHPMTEGVIMSNGSTLSGMTVSAVGSDGVWALGSDVTIINNTINVSASGTEVAVGVGLSRSNALISGNTITVTSTSTNVTSGLILGGTDNVRIANNTISVSNTGGGPSVGAFGLNGTGIAAGSTGNTVTMTGGTGTGTGSACSISGGGNTGTIEYTSGGISGSCP